MPGVERHTKVLTICPPSVQKSSLCRHDESYKHKDASIHAEKVTKFQIVY